MPDRDMRSTRAILLAFLLSGVSALIYEVVWTRALTLVLGSTVYAVSTMLSTFMAGLAIGSYVGGKLSDRSENRIALFGLCELGIGVGGLASIPLIYKLPALYLPLYRGFHGIPYLFLSLQVFLCALVMLVPTVLMGVTFPLVSRSITENLTEMGRKVGDAYSMNTVGAVVGSLLAGFLLIPLVGIKGASFVAAALNLTVGFLMLVKSRRPASTTVVVLLVAFCGAGGWNLSAHAEAGMLNFYNAYRYLDGRPYEVIAQLEEADLHELYRRELPEGSVRALRASNGSLLLQVGGKVEGTNIDDIPNTVLLALIPIATHPGPHRLLNIGLGSGVTLGAAKPLVGTVNLVEINPGVVEAVALHGEPGLLDGVRVITDDARNYLLSTEESYDVISSEPSYPTESGVTSLFTREYYEIAARRLASGGVYCQWLPYYILTTDDVTMMIKTFTSVFPHAFLWKIPVSGDLILIGSREAFSFTAEEISRRVEALNRGKYQLNYVLSRTPEQLAEVARQPEIPFNTDDHPRLEFNVVNNILLRNLAEKNKQRKFQTR